MSEAVDFNCECGIDETYETLAELRRRMMVRLGYAAQADNPPPSMSELIDDFLISAQRTLMRKNPQIETERFYSWQMVAGQRYYGIADGDDGCETPRRLDKYRVSWVGYEDLNGAWLPLTKGINPVLYSQTVNLNGWPGFYDIRSCIEVWPAPQAAFTLWVRGYFGLMPFEENGDQTTLDSELVFLKALGDAKKHYGQRDADSVLQQAGTYLLDIKSGKHQTARYIPGTRTLLPMPQPILLPLPV